MMMCVWISSSLCVFLPLAFTYTQPTIYAVIIHKKSYNIVTIRLIVYWCYSCVYFEKLPFFFFVNDWYRAVLKKISRNLYMRWVIDSNVHAPDISHCPCVILTTAFNSYKSVSTCFQFVYQDGVLNILSDSVLMKNCVGYMTQFYGLLCHYRT